MSSPQHGFTVWRTATLVAAAVFCLAAGTWQVASTVAQSQDVRPQPGTIVVDGVSYRISHVEQVRGLADADLGGMSHGIQSLVTDDKTMVTVSLVVSAGRTATTYDAGVLRAVTPTGSVVPVGGTLSPGRLRANAHIEGSLSFVVARNGAQLRLRGPSPSPQLALLRVDRGPTRTDTHHHTSASPSPGRPTP